MNDVYVVYSKEEFLIKHKEDCQGIGKTAVRIEMPEDGKNIIKFKSYNKQQKLPYILFMQILKQLQKMLKEQKEIQIRVVRKIFNYMKLVVIFI